MIINASSNFFNHLKRVFQATTTIQNIARDPSPKLWSFFKCTVSTLFPKRTVHQGTGPA